jgi:TetR/AcrR family transcriptional repressor of mexCD-oprJ operon
MSAAPKSSATDKRRRADAERSVASILEASVEALASDPDVSMAEIARRAGVVRATIYVHFPTRETLLEAVTAQAIAEVARVLQDAEPHHGPPAEALERVVRAAWRALGRFHALVTINSRLPQTELERMHRPVLDLLAPLIRRGQRDGTFRSDVSVAWHLSMLLAIVHAASEHIRGQSTAAESELALVATVLGAVARPA